MSDFEFNVDHHIKSNIHCWYMIWYAPRYFEVIYMTLKQFTHCLKILMFHFLYFLQHILNLSAMNVNLHYNKGTKMNKRCRDFDVPLDHLAQDQSSEAQVLVYLHVQTMVSELQINFQRSSPHYMTPKLIINNEMWKVPKTMM